MCQYHRNAYTCGHSGRLIFRQDASHNSACDKSTLPIKDYKYPYKCDNCKAEARKQAEEESLKLKAVKTASKAEKRISGGKEYTGRPGLGFRGKSWGAEPVNVPANSPPGVGGVVRRGGGSGEDQSRSSGESSGKKEKRVSAGGSSGGENAAQGKKSTPSSAASDDGKKEGGTSGRVQWAGGGNGVEVVKGEVVSREGDGRPVSSGGGAKHRKQLSRDSAKDCVVQ